MPFFLTTEKLIECSKDVALPTWLKCIGTQVIVELFYFVCFLNDFECLKNEMYTYVC